MPGRTPREAAQVFLGPINRAFTCISHTPLWLGGGYAPGPKPHLLVPMHPGNPVALGGERTLLFSVLHAYRFTESEQGGWNVTTASYLYSISDADDREIVAFHWHPSERIPFPHIHVANNKDLAKLHLASGRVSLEAIIRMLIREMGVLPRRPDWEQVLDETEAGYRASRSWA